MRCPGRHLAAERQTSKQKSWHIFNLAFSARDADMLNYDNLFHKVCQENCGAQYFPLLLSCQEKLIFGKIVAIALLEIG